MYSLRTETSVKFCAYGHKFYNYLTRLCEFFTELRLAQSAKRQRILAKNITYEMAHLNI
jgi:hypothetical protein